MIITLLPSISTSSKSLAPVQPKELNIYFRNYLAMSDEQAELKFAVLLMNNNVTLAALKSNGLYTYYQHFLDDQFKLGKEKIRGDFDDELAALAQQGTQGQYLCTNFKYHLEKYLNLLTVDSQPKDIVYNLNLFFEQVKPLLGYMDKLTAPSGQQRLINKMSTAINFLYSSLSMIASTLIGKGVFVSSSRKAFYDKFFVSQPSALRKQVTALPHQIDAVFNPFFNSLKDKNNTPTFEAEQLTKPYA